MPFRFFWVSATRPEGGENDLNAFLRSHRTVSITRELAMSAGEPGWAICVEFAGGLESPEGSPEKRSSNSRRVDYRDVLPPEDFRVFSVLRAWRKEVSESEKVPVYTTILTNEIMAAIAVARASSPAELGKIPGIGPEKLEKYGKPIGELMAQFKVASDAKGNGS